MSQFEFNGMLDSALPAIYINRITLEQKNSRPLSNNKYDTTPHLDESATGYMGLDYGGFQDVLSVTFDSFMEFPDLDSSNFFNLVEGVDGFNALTLNVFLFTSAAKDAYDWLITSGGAEFLAKPLLPGSTLQQYLDGNNLVSGKDYQHVALGGADLYSLIYDPTAAGPGTISNWAFFKQRHEKQLPDGSTVYKIPLKIKAEINGAFPDDLFALAFCAVDLDAMDLDKYGAGAADVNIVPAGRIAKEIIIQDGKLQEKGMMFFVSKDQSVPNNAELSKARNAAFDHLKGDLWFGGVHKHGLRYMAGNAHVDQMHPYLDYIVVPNSRIHDYRLINIMQKQLMSFSPMTNLVFGGDYIDFRSVTAPVALDNPAIFSDLISSIDKEGAVKLFFSVDWGKLIKQYCAIPDLIDKASSSPDELEAIFRPNGAALRPISFRIFRERVDIPHSVVDEESNRKLIYDRYPQFYFFDQVGAEYQLDGTPLKLPALSSLIPVQLDSAKSPFNGIVGHYSLTDYSTPKTEKGKFKYSVDIQIADPTVPYLMAKYTMAQDALRQLKDYMQLATAPSNSFYNKYLGEFNKEFKDKASKTVNFGAIQGAFRMFEILTSTTRSQWTKPQSKIAVEDADPGAEDYYADWGNTMLDMIAPNWGTPDSIVAVYSILSTLTSQLKNIIEGFSTANVPKTASFVEVDSEGNKVQPPFSKVPVGSALPQRTITVNHVFNNPAELVSTKQRDAGYDFFASQKNVYKHNSGLKVIDWSSYIQRSDQENEKYFINDIINNFSDTFQFEGDSKQYPFVIDSNVAKGRFFTLGDFKKSVVLPKTVKSGELWELGGDKTSWMIANNIIRYKFNLLGNPDENSFLGYGDNDPIPGDEVEITTEMERIIKEYQSLSFKGAVFDRARYRSSEISSVRATGDRPSVGDFTPPETGGITIAGQPIEDFPGIEQKMPWQKIIGQEDFLLALIMQNYLKLGYWDVRLRAFDIQSSSTPLGAYVNSVLFEAHPVDWYLEIPDLTPTTQIATVLQPTIDALPNQIKVLMINNTHVQGQTLPGGVNAGTIVHDLNERVRYAAPTDLLNTLYSLPPADEAMSSPSKKNQIMFLNKFGEFWFRHQNIVEVEYLSGYGTLSQIPGAPANGYEYTYNSSVKAPMWAPLTAAAANSPSGEGLLLCRLKKYKNAAILNPNVGNILDLPLYNEYFFIKPETLQLQHMELEPTPDPELVPLMTSLKIEEMN